MNGLSRDDERRCWPELPPRLAARGRVPGTANLPGLASDGPVAGVVVDGGWWWVVDSQIEC